MATVIALAVTGAVLLALPALAAPMPTSEGRWIVSVADGVDPVAVASTVGARGVRPYTQAFTGFAASLTEPQARAVAADPRVTSIEPNRALPARRDVPRSKRRAPSTQAIPNNIARVGATQSPTARIDGRDERVDADIAVLDGGVSNHPDFDLAGGVDCVGDGRGFTDFDGHGTEVAGVAAAFDNRIGVVGVAPGARIWSVRIFDTAGNLSLESLLCGVDWVRTHARQLDVMNMSFYDDEGTVDGACGIRIRPSASLLGLPKFGVVDPFDFALCRIAAAGVTPVASAGNDHSDTTGPPAAYPEVINVSGFNDTDGKPGAKGGDTCFPGEFDDDFATFSNYGRTVDISAPATCIATTYLGGQYTLTDGTSFSAPAVAGAAALIRARQPVAPVAAVRAQILGRAEPGPIHGDPDPYPEGRLNVRGL